MTLFLDTIHITRDNGRVAEVKAVDTAGHEMLIPSMALTFEQKAQEVGTVSFSLGGHRVVFHEIGLAR